MHLSLPVCRTYAQFSVALIVSLLSSGGAQAETTTVTSLFPGGAQVGETITVTARGKFDQWPVQAWIDKPGIEFKPQKDKGKFTVHISPDAHPGVYSVRLYGKQSVCLPRGFVVGQLPEVVEQDANDHFRKPQDVTTPVVVNARIEKGGDVDCFRFTARTGQPVRLRVTANHYLNSPMDVVLQVTDDRGNVLAQQDDTRGYDPFLQFDPPADGQYLARIMAFPTTPNSTIGYAGGPDFVYRLAITSGPVLLAARPLAVQRSQLPGKIQLESTNGLHEVDLPADSSQHVVWASSPAALDSLPLPVVDSDCHFLGNGQSAISVDVPVTVSSPLSRTARQIRWQAKKNTNYTINVAAVGRGFAGDPWAVLRDADGKQLAEYDDNKKHPDIKATFKSPIDGEITLEIADRFASSSPHHFFVCSLREASPRFRLEFKSMQVIGEVGKPIELELNVIRESGFAGDVTVSLPKELQQISGEPVVCSAKEKSVKLTVVANQPFVGPIQVLGQAAQDEGIRAEATQPSMPWYLSRHHIWGLFYAP